MKGYRKPLPFGTDGVASWICSNFNPSRIVIISFVPSLCIAESSIQRLWRWFRIWGLSLGKLIWLQLEVVLVIGVNIIIVNNNMDVEDWFDKLGKMNKLDYMWWGHRLPILGNWRLQWKFWVETFQMNGLKCVPWESHVPLLCSIFPGPHKLGACFCQIFNADTSMV